MTNDRISIQDNKNCYNNIPNSDYFWSYDGVTLTIMKRFNVTKRFFIRTLFVICFSYGIMMSNFALRLNSYPYIPIDDFIIFLICLVLSIPGSKYYISLKRQVDINTSLKSIYYYSPFLRSKFNFDKISDIKIKRSFIGGQFQIAFETLIVVDTKGKKHKIARYMMPDKDGFLSIIKAIKQQD